MYFFSFVRFIQNSSRFIYNSCYCVLQSETAWHFAGGFTSSQSCIWDCQFRVAFVDLFPSWRPLELLQRALAWESESERFLPWSQETIALLASLRELLNHVFRFQDHFDTLSEIRQQARSCARTLHFRSPFYRQITLLESAIDIIESYVFLAIVVLVVRRTNPPPTM